MLDPLGASVLGRPRPIDKRADKALIILDFLNECLHEHTALRRQRLLVLHLDHDVCDDAQVEGWLDLLDLACELFSFFEVQSFRT